jgi:hypothetical protein
MKLCIAVSRNPANNYTMLHKPLVSLNDGEPRQMKCRTYELLDYLKSAGFSSDGEINWAQKEIEEKGQTVLEPTKIIDAGLKRLLEV